MMEILRTLNYAREQAYVTALIAAESGKTIVGHLGWIPTGTLWAAGAWPIPVLSQDDTTLQYARELEGKICPPLQATAGYAKTDKCPLIHASSVLIVNTNCPQREKVLPYFSTKKIIYFDPQKPESYQNRIEEIVGKVTDDALAEAEILLTEIRKKKQVLRSCLEKGKMTFSDWAVIQNGIRFIPELQDQDQILGLLVQELEQRPERQKKTITVSYTTIDRIDPGVLRLFDDNSVKIVRKDCEEREDSEVDRSLPLCMKHCIYTKGDEPFTLKLSETEKTELARLQHRIQEMEE